MVMNVVLMVKFPNQLSKLQMVLLAENDKDCTDTSKLEM